MPFLERKYIKLSIFEQFPRVATERVNLEIGPTWRVNRWKIMFVNLVVGDIALFVISQNAWSIVHTGNLHQLYLHIFDKMLVLTASRKGKRITIASIILSGRLLSISGARAREPRFFSLGGMIQQ